MTKVRKPSGGYSGGDTPVPIPNTEVKPSSADGTAEFLGGRVGRRRILLERGAHLSGLPFFLIRTETERRPEQGNDGA